MILLIIALIVSFIPILLVYWFLRNRIKDEGAYKTLCGSALKTGLLCIFPVILFSAIFQIVLAILDILLVLLLVRFAIKARKQALYTEPLPADLPDRAEG